jgi:inosine/xanthosine triphosphatase
MASKKKMSGRTVVVNVGSTNPGKVKCAEIAFRKVKVIGFGAPSNVDPQPKGIATTVRGAKNRAIGAYKSARCDFGIGLEAGIIKFPGRTGWIDMCICALYDGKEFYYGMSPGFEFPKFMVERHFSEGLEIGEILDRHFNAKNLRHGMGVIGWISKGRMDRIEYMEPAVLMALSTYMNKELY